MDRTAPATEPTLTAWSPTVVESLRRAVGTRRRRWLAALTVVLGLVAAVALATATPEPQRTFASISAPTQLLMSVPVPFFGALLATDLRRGRASRIAPTVLAGVVLAVVFAGLGVLLAVSATLAAPSSATDGRWAGAGAVVLGCVLAQVLAELEGIAFGLLIGSPVPACAATIVVPLGMWLLLGSVDALRPAQPWLTPFPSAQHLLSGQMTPLAWTQWLVVAVIWGSSLNAYGVMRHRTVVG